jgi:hypothetical protein
MCKGSAAGAAPVEAGATSVSDVIAPM